jgi:hypothetical protein
MLPPLLQPQENVVDVNLHGNDESSSDKTDDELPPLLESTSAGNSGSSWPKDLAGPSLCRGLRVGGPPANAQRHRIPNLVW